MVKKETQNNSAFIKTNIKNTFFFFEENDFNTIV